MDQQVVQPDRRDVVRQRLQRQPVVARGKPQLCGFELLGRLDAGQIRGMCGLACRAAILGARGSFS